MAASERGSGSTLCAHEPCTCPGDATSRDGLAYCHDLCSDASQAAQSEGAYPLCPCLHAACSADGGKSDEHPPAATVQGPDEETREGGPEAEAEGRT